MDRLDAWTAWERLDSQQIGQILRLRETGLGNNNLAQDAYEHDRLMGHLEVVHRLSDPQHELSPSLDPLELAAVVKQTIRLLSTPKKPTPTATDGFQDSPLARLPPELCELIYAEALPDKTRLKYCVVPVNFHGGADTGALLRVCKQVRQEAAKLLYATWSSRLALGPAIPAIAVLV